MPGNSQSVSPVIRFGPFDADLQTQELHKHGVRLRLPGQSFQILKMVLERQGQLVTREDFQKALWPSDTFVDFDHSLNAAVNRLREALGDSADEPHLIETLPRRGYRFIGTIKPPAAEAPSAKLIAAGPAGAAAERRPAVVSRWTWSRIAAVLFTAVACILVATLAVL